MAGGWRRARRRRRLAGELAVIWCEVLGRERVGPREEFLELGGDSVAAIRIIGRAEELTGVELSIRLLLETGTIAGMAERLERIVAGEEP
ncbi:hypothetical protein GCM10017673_31530 [Streptosporangium violaceochromogenes]|nr:hypothetical protein GCM10017673_31530 [Streptosporangium violaceochromogenes]